MRLLQANSSSVATVCMLKPDSYAAGDELNSADPGVSDLLDHTSFDTSTKV